MRTVLLVSTLAACSFQPGTLPGSDATPDSPDTPVDAEIILGPFGAPVPFLLPMPDNSDDDPSLTGDLREIYINTNRVSNADVYVSTRATTADAWSDPILVPLISSTANETTPEVTGDGLTMFVASDRLGAIGGNDLWISTRASRTDPWPDPARIEELSSSSNEACGGLTADGRTVVFTSTRINGSPDVFIADRASTAAPWGNPVAVEAVNTTGHEGSVVISADGLTLYFDTDRDGNMELYYATRATRSNVFSAALPLAGVNSADADQDPWVSPDGRRLVFQSNRGGTNQLWEATR